MPEMNERQPILIHIRCTNCGSEFENVDPHQTVFHCTAAGCGATFLTELGQKFAEIEMEKAGKIETWRRGLAASTDAASCDKTQAAVYADEIMKMIPDDFRANIVSFLCRKDHHLYRAYLGAATCTEEEFEEIFPFMLQESDYRDLRSLEKNLSKYTSSQEKLSEHRSAIKKKDAELEKNANNFADIHRDVFICHSGEDDEVSMDILETLEAQNLKCWINTRNLRRDSENYWADIERAISQCDIFLVVCSNAAQMSKDVDNELSFAEKYHCERLEVKIDKKEHLYRFHEFFDGISWIEAWNGFDKTAKKELVDRTFRLKKKMRKEKEASENPEKKSEKQREENRQDAPEKVKQPEPVKPALKKSEKQSATKVAKQPKKQPATKVAKQPKKQLVKKTDKQSEKPDQKAENQLKDQPKKTGLKRTPSHVNKNAVKKDPGAVTNIMLLAVFVFLLLSLFVLNSSDYWENYFSGWFTERTEICGQVAALGYIALEAYVIAAVSILCYLLKWNDRYAAVITILPGIIYLVDNLLYRLWAAGKVKLSFFSAIYGATPAAKFRGVIIVLLMIIFLCYLVFEVLEIRDNKAKRNNLKQVTDSK